MASATVSRDHFAANVESISDDRIVLHVPGTDYQLELVLESPLAVEVGDRVEGVIHAVANRVDVVKTGGRFVEPVYGRPRRVQGKIVGGNVSDNSLTIHAGGALVIAKLGDKRQNAADYKTQQLVAFDVLRGAVFRKA